jgi:hypothetical protein
MDLAALVDQTLAEVSGYVKNQESVTVLSQALTIDGLTLQVDDVSSLSKGTLEVGDELVYAKAINKTSATATVMPAGRGWRGTTATAHDLHTLVRNNPTFPRSQVKRALNDTIAGIDLFGISSHSFNFNGTTYAYALPAGAKDVTGVTWDPNDSTGVWGIIRRYRVDRNFPVDGDVNPRTGLVLLEFPAAGRDVRVQYTHLPSALADGEDFSLSGLPASAVDVIRLGAMWRLVTTVDSSKVVASSPSADLVDSKIAAGQPTALARYIYQLFSVRLAEEKAKQIDVLQNIVQFER